MGAPWSMAQSFVVVVESHGVDGNEESLRPWKKRQMYSADAPHNSLGNLLGRDCTNVLKRRAKRSGSSCLKYPILTLTKAYIADENPRRMYTSPTRESGRHPPCSRAEL